MLRWFGFRGLRTRLLATYLFLIVLSLGVFIWRVGTWLDASRLAETQRDQEGRAILMASASEELLEKRESGQIGDAALQHGVLTLAERINQRVMLLDPDGKIVVDSEHVDDVNRNISDLPEIRAAFQGRVTYDVRFDQDDGMHTLFTAAPIWHDTDLMGIVRLELPMSAVAAASQQMWTQLAGAGLLAALATVLVSFLFAQSLVRPLGELTRAAFAMTDGDLRQRIRARGPEEMQHLARSFNLMAERLAAVMEDQRAFVANAAHELRTPLTTIALRAEALQGGAMDEPEVASRFLGDIAGETERLSRLTEELLSLSRIETGLVEPRRQAICMQTLIATVVGELSAQAKEAGLTIQTIAPDNVPPVQANPDQIRQVLINLVGNAIKYTPAEGTIVVHTSVGERRTISQLGAGRWLLTRVSDTGIGIPNEDLHHVFDRFYRSDKARASDTGGAGLGLAIVKSIVDAHQGHVWAESEKEKGSVFTFALPL